MEVDEKLSIKELGPYMERVARLVSRASPLPNPRRGKGSGKRAYSISFCWNAIIHVHYWVWLTRRQQLASCEFCAVEKRRRLYHAAAAWGREK